MARRITEAHIRTNEGHGPRNTVTNHEAPGELKRVVARERVPVDQAGGAPPYSAASAMSSAVPKWLNMPVKRLRSGGR